eukprot:Gb_26772 [translate_table: standard]
MPQHSKFVSMMRKSMEIGQADIRRLHSETEIGFRWLYRVYGCAFFGGLMGLIYYRITNLPSQDRLIWVMMFGAELWFIFVWIIQQAFRWRPINRQTFSDVLSQRLAEKELPAIDIFICTADPVKEPPVTTVNTVLSSMAYDYPVEKLAIYLSDDGGSLLTFYALLEASTFAKKWLPFCKKYCIEPRCPEPYFSQHTEQFHQSTSFASEWKIIKRDYEAMKDRINTTVESRTVPEEAQSEHKGFKEWSSGITARDHPTIVQILVENGEDMDVEGCPLPSLVYVSREKRPGYPHHYKAGALNALTRVSGVMTNAPMMLNLDCDMYANNCQALRQAMCFFLDPRSGHRFGYVQFPQSFHGITKNDIYANHLMRLFHIEFKGADGIDGPLNVGSGCIYSRDALCGRELHLDSKPKTLADTRLKEFHISNTDAVFYESCKHKFGSSTRLIASILRLNESAEIASLSNVLKDGVTVADRTYEEKTEWGRSIGLIYGCAVEDVLTGFTLQCRGWKAAYCTPNKKAFLGTAPQNLHDTLTQNKRWAAGELEMFVSRFCPYLYGIGKIKIAQRMCYSFYSFWPLWSIPMLCYGLLPALCMLNGVYLFPKVSDTWFLLFASLSICAYGYDMVEFLCIGGSVRSWWNEQRMWMLKRVTSYLFALMEVVVKLLGISDVGFEITNKAVSDSEAIQRYESEAFEFRVASPMFVPPSVLAVVNLICLLGGVGRVLRQGYGVLDSVFVQMLLSSFVVLNSFPILEGMFFRKDKGRMPTSISLLSIVLSLLLCSVFSLGHTYVFGTRIN